MNNLKVTLYDLFGYLLPGALALLATLAVYWAIFAPAKAFPLGNVPVAVAVGAVLASYVLGHMVQAIGNSLRWVFPRGESLVVGKKATHPISADILAAAKKKLATTLSVTSETINDDVVFDAARHTAPFGAGAEAYDLYVYREGFYRGLAVSLLLLASSLVLLCLRGATTILLDGSTVIVSASAFWLTAAILLFCAWLSWKRYTRFARYRVGQMVYGFLLAPERKQDKPS